MSDYLSASKAAKYLGCSETLIRKRIQSGALRATKKGSRWLIAREDLDKQTVGPNPLSYSNHTRTESVPELEPHSNHIRTGPSPELEPHPNSHPNRTRTALELPSNPHSNQFEWRDDLLAQIARLEADKVVAADREREFERRDEDLRSNASRREEVSKARIIDLERELTVRDSRLADVQAAYESRIADMQAERNTEVTELRGQVAILEAKVRETLEERAEEIGKLATSITELVGKQQEMQTRVYELEPVADQVPMLQAAVEEKDATLSERERELGNVRDDIEAIASRPVTGPVFRLLTKGKLRR